MDDVYDQRQYNMMMAKIRAFEEGQIGHLSLEADLSALVEALRTSGEDRKNELRAICNKMDVLIAIIHDEVGFARNDPERAAFHDLVRQFTISIASELEKKGGSRE